MYLHQGATLVIWLSCTWQHSNQRRIRLGTTDLGTGCNHKSRRESNLIYRLASYCNRLPSSGGTLLSMYQDTMSLGKLASPLMSLRNAILTLCDDCNS
ncbi:hypothetical protein E4T42_03607 [Aureobasidium subglaciale]|nr:hypothetical protein E4T42_03607 [Aureobasidium subglaciale]